MIETFSLDAFELQSFQPNRYPFLMIDRVTEVKPGEYAKGFKNLSNNEWFFPVHFVGNPNMPGVLQLEALAQLLTITLTTLPGLKGEVTHGLNHKVRLRKEVKPGDRLDLEVKITSWSRGICIGEGSAFVGGDLACNAQMVITVPHILEKHLPDA
jgi:3-hydroxyacyl-[acyl-carrier-protein] dehydratase